MVTMTVSEPRKEQHIRNNFFALESNPKSNFCFRNLKSGNEALMDKCFLASFPNIWKFSHIVYSRAEAENPNHGSAKLNWCQ